MLKKINATGNLGCTLFNSECTISAGNTLRIGPDIDVFINQRSECYLNNTINLRPLTPHMLYPQNGDVIVAIDFVTSLHPVCNLTR